MIQTDDGRLLLDPSGEFEFQSLPKGMFLKPSLVWTVESSVARTIPVEVSFLTKGMSWEADYSLYLDSTARTSSLFAWATIRNNCGKSFKNSLLKFVAGEVFRARPSRTSSDFIGIERYTFDPIDNSIVVAKEESFSDYHLYTFPISVNLADKEQKQVAIISSRNIPISRSLTLSINRDITSSTSPSYQSRGTGIFHPENTYKFTNDEKSHLGMALPAGLIKMYMDDDSGSKQLIGEGFLEHTPKGETLELTCGQSFDVVCERKRTFFKWIDDEYAGASRETFEIDVRNHSSKPKEIDVDERVFRQWKIISASTSYQKRDSNTVRFHLSLKPGESKVVRYTVVTT